MSFEVGGSKQLFEKMAIGLKFNYIFGSSRYDEIIQFNSSPSVIVNTRSRYTGLLGAIYLDFIFNEKLNFYSKYSIPINPVDVAVLNRPIFEDVNDNNYHDYSFPEDFPHPDSLKIHEEERLKNIHDPVEYSIAIEYKLNGKTFLSSEINQFVENGNYNLIKSPMNNSILKLNNQKIQFTRFNDDLSLNYIDKFITRIGAQIKNIALERKIRDKEISFSFGVGFKFKKIGNQIDFNYFIGNRVYQRENNESFQQFQVSTDLADIWFVKGRQK